VATLDLNHRAPDFDGLPATDGERYGLESFASARMLVVVFVANGCPTVRALEPWLIEFQDTYGPRAVQVLWVNSNNDSLSPADTQEEMKMRAKVSGLNFPYLKDKDGSVARSFGATNTPHVFVMDDARRIRYRGRVADSRQASTIRRPYLRDAVDELLADRHVTIPDTEPYGCSIVW
jgi:peroxiredoxin